MPILPSEQESSPLVEPHRARHVAESFGTDPERYDRARPTYPDAMVDAVVAGSPGPEFLDVGIGTGIAARRFRAAGCRVLGVDADERMAAFARRSGFAVEVARFEDWAAAGRMFDAVVAGQTWHWVDPVAGAVKAAEVLRPSGRLAVFWNAAQLPPELTEAFAEVYRRVRPDSLASRGLARPALDSYSIMASMAADGIRKASGFDDPDEWRFDWQRIYTRDEFLDQVPTTGGHHDFSVEELNAVLTGIGATIDAVGGSFTMQYATVVTTAARRPL